MAGAVAMLQSEARGLPLVRVLPSWESKGSPCEPGRMGFPIQQALLARNGDVLAAAACTDSPVGSDGLVVRPIWSSGDDG
jgi:hypothetical protein